ncbi:MAG: V-type ATP synthase subunit A [Candidatus Aureabacteria bacterium]|nr:V-type ATP synthase subunit A [Candidatus Auribacterota bacterium]
MKKKENIGKIVAINGNMITVEFTENIRQNEVAYALLGEERLKSEVIRIKNNRAELQVYEETRGLKVGTEVEFSGEMLTVELGPGLLTQIYDGLQNPLPEIAEKCGFFLPKGLNLHALDMEKKWEFDPCVKVGDSVSAGHFIGSVPEGLFKHSIMIPFYLTEKYTVEEIVSSGSYAVKDIVAKIKDESGKVFDIQMYFEWPVRISVTAYKQRLQPVESLVTRIRLIDTLFPVAKGGTYCIPGPFGAGKTVLQQITSRHAEVDIVLIAACGERAGEVVETLREFPEIEDPRTGKPLMERTIIICNTSSMPVSARESSVYTAITMAEYYRQMGLNVLLLADSTSRWAQAMREISGRLEEIPGEEAFPAYLESRIAAFYERAGLVELYNGEKGSVTVGGTVSPAGGNFEEPVTQGTLKVVGAFHGLSRDRSNARRYPSIDPLESWSKYPSFIDIEKIKKARAILFRGNEVDQMMKVVGEEGTSIDDYIIYLKSEYFDFVYLQQNAFDEVDAATVKERQIHVFDFIIEVLSSEFKFRDKDHARNFFQTLRQMCIDWNFIAWETDEFKNQEEKIRKAVDEVNKNEKSV